MAGERTTEGVLRGRRTMGRPDAAATVRTYAKFLWQRRWLILIVAAATVASAWVFTRLQTPIYQATATVLIEPEPPKVVNIQEVTPGTGPSQDYYATQYKVIQSRAIVEGVIERLKLKEKIPELGASSDPYGPFFSRLTVEPAKNTRLVMIKFEDPSPKLAAEVANAVANGYVQYNLDIKSRMAQEAATWLQEQVGGLVSKADRSAAALQAYQAKADVLGIQEQRQIITQKIIAHDRAHLEAQGFRQAAEAKLREITRILKDPEASEAVFTVIDDPMVRKLKAEASDLLAERSKLRELYRAKHPDLITIEAQIKHVNGRIREEVGKLRQAVENEYQVAKAREAGVAAGLNELRRDAQQLVSKEARALALQREKDSSEEILATVMKRLKETGLTTGLEATNVRVVEPATVPTYPARPRKQLIQILSVILGLGLGVGLAFVAESFDNRIRSPQDVERALELPVIGVVPVFNLKRKA